MTSEAPFPASRVAASGTAAPAVCGLGFGVLGLGFGVWGLLFGVWDMGYALACNTRFAFDGIKNTTPCLCTRRRPTHVQTKGRATHVPTGGRGAGAA